MQQMRSRFRQLKLGIIGDGVHSLRIQKVLKSFGLKYLLYKPTKNKFKYVEIEEIKKCKIIFIISPNSTHFDYIKKFYKKRYIFCEKPPVNILSELNDLKKLNAKKIFFNFNFRYSLLSEVIKKKNIYKLGNLQYGNIITTHGLAKKKKYPKMWRSKIKLSPKGVFETVSIHWVDFINFHFEIKKVAHISLKNSSNKGTAFDNSYIDLKLKNDANINIFNSYNSPYCNKALFVFSNGIIEKDEKSIKIFGPSENYDKKGFFIKPKLIKKMTLNEEKDYNESLKKSVYEFLLTASLKKKISKKNYKISLESNLLLF